MPTLLVVMAVPPSVQALTLVRPLPLPLNEPPRVSPVAVLVTTGAGMRAREMVPLDNWLAFRLVRPPALPLNVPLVMADALRPVNALPLPAKEAPMDASLFVSTIIWENCSTP